MAEIPGNRRKTANGKKRGKKGGEKMEMRSGASEEPSGREGRRGGRKKKGENRSSLPKRSSFLTTHPACESRSLITPPLPAGADLGILPENSSDPPELPAGFRRILRISQIKGISHVI
ncbi:hypothetical protein [Succinimonas sp.]|uniref:hypothetical protein n=1 Tax=Succinimonas sp. TaxID=1936151 RepID=UPI00386854E6